MGKKDRQAGTASSSRDNLTEVTVTNTGMFAGCNITGELSGTYVNSSHGVIDTSTRRNKKDRDR